MSDNRFIIKNGAVIESTLSGTTVFEVQGVNRTLLSVTDNMAGELFSIPNATGGTAFSVEADSDILVGRNITASQFIKSGGTSAQFLKADGSSDGNSYSQTGHTHSNLQNSIYNTIDLNTLNFAGGFSAKSALSSSPNIFPTVNNANAVLTVDMYEGGAAEAYQLGFSSSGNFYSRFGNATWYKVWSELNFNPANYLPLAGGTLTSALTVAGGADLNLKAPTGSDDSGGLVFLNGSGGELHRLWGGTSTLNYRASAGTTYQLLHTGNFTSYAAPASHNQAWSTITDRPTTLSGYGITDAAPATHYHDSRYQQNIFGNGITNCDSIGGLSVIANYQWTNSPSSTIGLLYTNATYAPNWFTQDFHSIGENRRFFRNYNGSNAAFTSWYEFWHTGNFNPGNYLSTTAAASTYLGISAKAVDSDKLDGNDSTYFAAASSLSNYSLTSHTHNQIYSSSNLPSAALLVNNRSDDEVGSAWIYWDGLGGTTNPWGIKHNQPTNLIEFYGAGNIRAYVDLNSGSGKVLVNSDIGTSVASQSHNHSGVYHPLMSTIFYLQSPYVGVRTANRTASQYYEFWDSGVGWAKIHSGGFVNANSSDSYILLGGGGTKAISDFSLNGHTHDDRYYTETESDSRYAYKAGSSSQDFSVKGLYFPPNATSLIWGSTNGGLIQIKSSSSTADRWARIGMSTYDGQWSGGMTINNDLTANFSSSVLIEGGLGVNGNTSFGGHLDITSALYLRSDIFSLNAAGNAWNGVMYRNGGSPMLTGISYEGNTIIHSGNIGSQSVNYATSSAYTNKLKSSASAGAIDLNSYLTGGGSWWHYGQGATISNAPNWFTYGTVYQFESAYDNSLSLQIATTTLHNTTTPSYKIGWRMSNNLGWQNDWKEIYHTGNLTNTLSDNYLPFWNATNGRLESAPLKYSSSNIAVGSPRPGDGGIGLFGQSYSMGYTYATKFVTFQSDTEQYGITNDYGVGTGAQLSIIANQTSGNIGFYTGGAKGDKNERMRILSNGNVVIGETYSPTIGGNDSRLDIYQGSVEKWLSISGTSDAPKTIGWIDRANSRAWIWSHRTDNSFNSYYYNGSSWLLSMSLATNGNVGIGTTNPVSYSNIVALTIGDNSSTKQGLLKFRSSYNSGDGAELWQNNSGLFLHNINGSTTAYTIQPNGNIGIGYTDRTEKLAVNGSGYFNGALSLYQGSGDVNYPIHTKQSTHQYLHIEGNGNWESMIRLSNINGGWYVGMRTSNTLTDFQFYSVATARTVASLSNAGSLSAGDMGVTPRHYFYAYQSSYGVIHLVSATSETSIGYRKPSGTGGWTVGRGIGGSEYFGWWNDDAGATRMHLSTAGALWTADSVTATAFYHSSDMTLKDVINPLDDVLGRVRTLDSFYYKLKSDESGKIYLGMSAQQFNDSFTYLTGRDSNDKLLLDYPRISVIAIKAIQEIDIIQQQHEKEVADLKANIEQLELRLRKLEEKLFGSGI